MIDELIEIIELNEKYCGTNDNNTIRSIISALRILATFPACADTGLPARWDELVYYHGQHGPFGVEYKYVNAAGLDNTLFYSTRKAADAARKDHATPRKPI